MNHPLHLPIQDIRVLEHMPRAAEARVLLEKAAKHVELMMRHRGLRCPLLAEFIPSNPGLLGMNTGGGGGSCHCIQIRLRPAHDLNSFRPLQRIKSVLMHELTHNWIAPHNQSFYALQREMYRDLKALKDGREPESRPAPGVPMGGIFGGAVYGGTGFPGFGPPLGGGGGGGFQKPRFPGKGRRLGSDSGLSLGGLPPAQAAAQAAEDRAAIALSEACGTGGAPGSSPASNTSSGEVIVLEEEDAVEQAAQQLLALQAGGGSAAAAAGPPPAQPPGQKRKRSAPAVVVGGEQLLAAPRRRSRAGRGGGPRAPTPLEMEVIVLSDSDDEGGASGSAAPLGMLPWTCKGCRLFHAKFCPRCTRCGRAH